MLKEIHCDLFKQKKIIFRKGLNIILGDDDAQNSIGKSTALMVIDFVQGGTTFLEDASGAIKALGQHEFKFMFQFGNEFYFFTRSTAEPEVIEVCDHEYVSQEQASIDEYRKMLKELYQLNELQQSFRSIVSPFSRIWKKGGLEPDQPFAGDPREQNTVSISRLIDLFEKTREIDAEKQVLDDQKDRKKLITGSMNASIIPSINKTQFKYNAKLIESNSLQIDQLKRGFNGALNAYEALFDDNLRKLQQRKNQISELRNELQAKMHRLQREIQGITPRLAANISLVAEFFPTVDTERLGQVEAFHQKIGSIVKKELKEEFETSEAKDRVLAAETLHLENSIQSALNAKGMPDDLFNRIFTLKEETDKAANENQFFQKKADLEETIKISNRRLDSIYSSIFLGIEAKINQKLRFFNKVVYGPLRSSSELNIKNASSYSFTSPDDTGTGKSFAGLIGFDTAILALTKIPFVIHDSVIYKNIELPATKRILRILSKIRRKQIFLSFDEAHKFGRAAEQRIVNATVLKLSQRDLLYNRAWRERPAD